MNWLYRYVFRGIGILLVVGLITLFFLAISFLACRTGNRSAEPKAHQHAPVRQRNVVETQS
jgi:hypothetical protein